LGKKNMPPDLLLEARVADNPPTIIAMGHTNNYNILNNMHT